ncbi:MAG TPA: hypothetical protein VLX56_09405 [Nitrososphaerales archaeon]|nr:hypothetical protein [Nitrososphaerales archaeon]
MSLAVSERQAREIGVFCEIARVNGAAISLGEVMRLAGLEASEREVEAAFLSDSRLRTRFRLDSGYVVERSSEVPARSAALEESRRRERAVENLWRASRFGASLLRGTSIVSVSGANAYLSAGEHEDIDFFCVTRPDGMWAFMLKALLLARIHMLAHREVPEICFSCIMDEAWATGAFRAKQPPIFARDALTAKVIGGKVALHALLSEAKWMEGYFPVLYGMRLRETETGGEEAKTHRRRGSSVLNSFLYVTLGSFLRMKSWARNRSLMKASSPSSIFATRIGKGHFIQESTRYRRLRNMYGDLESKA